MKPSAKLHRFIGAWLRHYNEHVNVHSDPEHLSKEMYTDLYYARRAYEGDFKILTTEYNTGERFADVVVAENNAVFDFQLMKLDIAPWVEYLGAYEQTTKGNSFA